MATLGLRVQVRHWRGLVWVATTGLGLLSVWNVKQIWEHSRGNWYTARRGDDFAKIIGGAQGEIDSTEIKLPDWNRDYKVLVTCPINGYEAQKPVVEPPSGPAIDTHAPDKKLDEVVQVTQVTDAPQDSGRVVVKYKDDTTAPRREELILKVGAPLAYPYDGEPYNGRLKRIKAETATFDWYGKEVELRPLQRKDQKSDKPKAAAAAATSKSTELTDDEKAFLEKFKNSDKTANYSNDGYVIGKKDFDDIQLNPDAYLREAQLKERPGPNKTTELSVGSIRPKSQLATEYGLQSNDVLVSINGVAMSTRSQAYDYVRNHQDLEKYVVVIKRAGREITKTVLVNRHR